MKEKINLTGDQLDEIDDFSKKSNKETEDLINNLWEKLESSNLSEEDIKHLKTATIYALKVCSICHAHWFPGNPDPCMKGNLPGVFAACCGHGNSKEAYISFDETRNFEYLSEYKALKYLYERDLGPLAVKFDRWEDNENTYNENTYF